MRSRQFNTSEKPTPKLTLEYSLGCSSPHQPQRWERIPQITAPISNLKPKYKPIATTRATQRHRAVQQTHTQVGAKAPWNNGYLLSASTRNRYPINSWDWCESSSIQGWDLLVLDDTFGELVMVKSHKTSWWRGHCCVWVTGGCSWNCKMWVSVYHRALVLVVFKRHLKSTLVHTTRLLSFNEQLGHVGGHVCDGQVTYAPTFVSVCCFK